MTFDLISAFFQIDTERTSIGTLHDKWPGRGLRQGRVVSGARGRGRSARPATCQHRPSSDVIIENFSFI